MLRVREWFQKWVNRCLARHRQRTNRPKWAKFEQHNDFSCLLCVCAACEASKTNPNLLGWQPPAMVRVDMSNLQKLSFPSMWLCSALFCKHYTARTTAREKSPKGLWSLPPPIHAPFHVVFHRPCLLHSRLPFNPSRLKRRPRSAYPQHNAWYEAKTRCSSMFRPSPKTELL